MESTLSSLTLEDEKPPALTGSCMCKKVTYSSSTLPSSLTNCHCQTCRRLSGAPFVTFAQFPTSSITFTSSTTLKNTSYSDIADRTHCAECGSPISMTYKCEPEWISITAGTFDEDSIANGEELPKVKQHIFLEEKAKAYEVPENDGVPKYSKFSTGFQKKIDSWKKLLNGPGLG